MAPKRGFEAVAKPETRGFATQTEPLEKASKNDEVIDVRTCARKLSVNIYMCGDQA